MAKTYKTTPEAFYENHFNLSAGDTLELGKGSYSKPIVFFNLCGTGDRPIVIKGKKPSASPKGVDRSESRIGTATEFEDFRIEANTLAREHEATGSFPGLYHIADRAMLTLRDCQWVELRNLTFENCWPTAIYIENCQNVTLDGLHILGGTFAIGATGRNTRHILVRDCNWIQDIGPVGEATVRSIRERNAMPQNLDLSECLLWKKTDWLQIHGHSSETDKPVQIETDARGFDGDFFRAWSIAGYVTFVNNVITDAFNAIHFFNECAEGGGERCSCNIVIEDNWFVRIRDNAVEPEGYAWNWIVRRNKFVDCYAPFSLEPGQSGYFYIYSNLCWNFHRPGPETDNRISGRMFKLGTRHAAVGPHYVIHNTWMVRGPLFKKKRISNFIHMNNVVGYRKDAEVFDYDLASPFGKGWQLSHYPGEDWEEIKKREKVRFTKDWRGLGITFDGDMIGHPQVPDQLRNVGYELGHATRGTVPVFASDELGVPDGLKVSNAISATEFVLEFPNGSKTKLHTGTGRSAVAGAWQDSDLFELPGVLTL